jgi:hypothetical protein
MGKNHVIFALKHKRAELAGLIPEAERRLESLRQARASVDTTLRRSDPQANPEGIKPRRTYKQRQTVFARKELSRLVMGALREADGPILGAASSALQPRGGPGAVSGMDVGGPGSSHRPEGRTVGGSRSSCCPEGRTGRAPAAYRTGMRYARRRLRGNLMRPTASRVIVAFRSRLSRRVQG